MSPAPLSHLSLARIRGVLLIASLLLAADWLSKLTAPNLFNIIHNPHQPALWLLPAVATLSGLLLTLIPGRLPLLGLGCLLGGVSANLLDRALFGPVLDWIQLPLMGDNLFNLADLGIGLGGLLLLGCLPRVYRLLWRG